MTEWSVRVRASGKHEAIAHSGKHSLRLGPPLAFETLDSFPTALEAFMCAVGSDVVGTFQETASRRRVRLYDLELAATCRLNNPLTYVGVIGEEGHPGVEEIAGTLYISGDLEQPVLDELWQETLRRSPLINTLRTSVRLNLRPNLM